MVCLFGRLSTKPARRVGERPSNFGFDQQGRLKDILFGSTGPRGGKRDGVVQTMAKSAARQVTNQIVRGMLGSLLGGRRR